MAVDYHTYNEYVQKLYQSLDHSLLQLSSYRCFACSLLSPSSLSGVLLLLHVLPVASFLYPTPVLSPWWVLFNLAPSFLNHVEIFGWFFVISSPLLLSLSSFSFFFFAAAAVCSPHYFFFISKFARPIAFFIRFWAPLSPFVSLSCLPRGTPNACNCG